jgi:hypothetical protein
MTIFTGVIYTLNATARFFTPEQVSGQFAKFEYPNYLDR